MSPIVMHYSGKKLSPYQDPIRADDLKIGDTCYLVSIENNTPSIHAFVFIGKNLELTDSIDGDTLYLQDSISYSAGVSYGAEAMSGHFPAIFFHQKATDLNGFYNLESSSEIMMFYALKSARG